MTQRVRVVIAEDSDAMRLALLSLVRRDQRLEVVGQAVDGVQAVAMAKLLRPDVMTMDIRMPKLNGLAATKKIMETAPTRILVICSLFEQREIDLSFEATGAGAVDVLPKPQAAKKDDLSAWGRRVVEAIRAVANAPIATKPNVPSSPPLAAVPGGVQAIGIAASTGGPAAVATVLSALPRDFPVPVLVAQHVASGFASGLQRWLSHSTSLAVVTAESGFPLRAGHVYLPPEGYDLEVHSHDRCAVVTPGRSLCTPSANRLFASLARAYGEHAVGVVLTGMGGDGTEGLLALRGAGAPTLAQDEASCVVYGMPRAAVTAGAVAQQMSIVDIGPALTRLCSHRRRAVGGATR